MNFNVKMLRVLHTQNVEVCNLGEKNML